MGKLDKFSISLVLLGSILAFYAWPVALGITFNESWSKFLNNDFATAVFGTLVAAFAGAYGAQLIVEHNKDHEAKLLEIRNVNAAIVTSFTICNTLIGLKRQHVKSIWEHFSRDKAVHDAALERARVLQGGGKIELNFRGDFRSLQIQKPPTELLQNQIFEKISASGRPLALAIMLDQVASSLCESIKMRNDLIERFRAIDNERLTEIYFGRKMEEFHDNTYPDLVKAIYDHLDDCIYFSELLCKDLQSHGETIKKNAGKNAPKISKPNFSQAYAAGLMPNPKLYEAWENAFIKG